ncbi:MAG: alanine--glyoxylate aminotransferase family protein [Ruminococcaceae bacterium]|jgi:aspartate aminotransferase-like enzyme|nr:alanine--glyoxylate aminotransferase family protein [Oscillospiraceae bacterium]
MDKNVLVMIPGPTPVVDSIRTQMGRPIQAFGDPRFVADYRALIDDLGQLFNCSGVTFPLAGTGTLAMEMAIANTTRRGDNVLIVSNGFFGDRFIDICERKGLNVDVLSAEWGDFVTPEQIDKKLSEKHYAAMTVTHVDTSTAVVAPIAEIGEVAKKYPDTVYIVDGVAATAGEYADVDGMHIDLMFTASQKAFGVCSGMFIVWAGKKALERRKTLGTIPEYYVDFDKWLPIMENTSKYFATPAVNLVWALKESVAIIKEEGLKARADRHRKNADAIAKAVESIGCTLLAKPGCRASTLSVILYPEGVDDAKFRANMLQEGVVCANSLGAYLGKSFRLGHMGNITENEIIVGLSAIERSLKACGADVKLGTAVGTYLAEMHK